MLKRTDYIELIEEIRNTEKKSFDDYIETVLEPWRSEDPNFIETLYKDIHYLIKGIDKIRRKWFRYKKRWFVIEDVDFKLTGYQSRLHNLSIGLHMEMVKKFMGENPLEFVTKVENFEKIFLIN